MWIYILGVTCYFVIAFISSTIIVKLLRGNFFVRLIRILTSYLPYYLIFFTFPFPKYSLNLDIKIVIFSLLAISLLLIFEYKSFVISISKNYSFLYKKPEKLQLLSRTIECTMVPMTEEIFFRGLIPTDTKDIYFIIICSILTNTLFIISHFIHRKWDVRFALKLLVLSLISTYIYIYTENILYSVIIHMIYNTPKTYSYFHRFFFHK